ncbi:hypothetical protein DFA_02987 [Cavenderia fasciculata]|uniref:Uncharacterized protein n=1 Tax=Cavenderia fasciculata TaxID=261658 RepID=F4PGA9_CACFS|nr:uncharacterized protein DFA_02987 [Cavenderia fasciculata]EGG24743.1 hypothetical protein DFA_02987 [Cavenderia fasciculata]|eukprot:XP_004362594.1 hypothetical protein DFA_02987 [Cavenderia fasciculata]
MSYSEKTGTQRRTGGANTRAKSSLFQVQFEGGKQLKTAQQKSYSIPNRAIEDLANKLKDPKATTGEPIFMSPDGTFYDINYLPVFKHKVPDRATLNNYASVNFDEDEEESLQEQLFHLYNTIPQIDEFDNFFDYEQAFLAWKFAVETIFQDIRLPYAGGRAYYRPRVSDYQRGRDNSTFDYRPSVSSFSHEGDSDEKSDPLNSSEIMDDEVGGLADSSEPFDVSMLRQDLIDSEPWDSHLYPVEPQPADYNTYEEYEEALTRWASVSAQLPFLPPHASQLKDLIPIQAISRGDNDSFISIVSSESKAEQLAKQTACIRSGIHEVLFFDNDVGVNYTQVMTSLAANNPTVLPDDVASSTTSSPSPSLLSVHFSKDAIFSSASQPIKQNIRGIVNNLLQKRQQNLTTHKSYVLPLLPRIHGTLSPSMPSLTKPNNSLKNTHLRRTDLTPEQLKGCLDCPAKVGGQNVNFKIPIHDIIFDFNRLKTDPSYAPVIINQFRTLNTADRHNPHFSWYNPLVTSSTHQKHRDDIDQIITSQHRITKDSLDYSNISEILYGNMYLDKFSDLLDTSFSEDFDGGKSYATVITKCIKPENIDELLSLVQCSKSPMFHAKMSFLVMNLFSGNQGSPIIERLIQNKDVKNLSLLTYSFDYLSDLPIDLYPWSDETYTLVKQVLGDSMENLIKLTFCYYYLTVIARVLDIHVHLYYSKSVVNNSKVSLAHSMATLLQQNTPDILDKLFTGIKHRSSTVSSFCLFVLLQFMHNQEGMAIHNCLRADSSFLFERVKGVCDSKMKHVQFAARRLFSVLAKAPWIDFIYKEYTKDPESAVRDFLGDDDKKPSNLLLEMTMDFFNVALDRTMEVVNASNPISNTTINTTPPLTPVGSPPPAPGGTLTPTITIGIKNKFLFVLDEPQERVVPDEYCHADARQAGHHPLQARHDQCHARRQDIAKEVGQLPLVAVANRRA